MHMSQSRFSQAVAVPFRDVDLVFSRELDGGNFPFQVDSEVVRGCELENFTSFVFF